MRFTEAHHATVIRPLPLSSSMIMYLCIDRTSVRDGRSRSQASLFIGNFPWIWSVAYWPGCFCFYEIFLWISPTNWTTTLSKSFILLNNSPYTGLFEMIVGVLTTCHTQYTWDRSMDIFYLIQQLSKFFYFHFSMQKYVYIYKWPTNCTFYYIFFNISHIVFHI